MASPKGSMADEKVPILPAESREEDSSPVGQRRQSRIVASFGLALAALAALACVVALVPRAAEPDTAPRGGAFLAEKVALVPDNQVVARADELVKAAQAASGKLQADRDQVEDLQKKADHNMKIGTHNVHKAKEELSDAADAAAKAKELRREAEAEIEKAKAMLGKSEGQKEQAKSLKDEGHQGIAAAKNLQVRAKSVHGRESSERASAEAAVAKEVEALEDEAKYLADEAKEDNKAADADLKAAKGKLHDAQAKVKTASATLKKAQADVSDAEETTRKAHDDIGEAKRTTERSASELKAGQVSQKQGESNLATGEDLATKATAAQVQVDAESAKVAKLEGRSADEAVAHRMCVDLPGARLRETGKPVDFAPLAVDKDVSSAAKCAAWCKQHEGCAQAIFATGSQACVLFEHATTEVQEWNAAYNSTLCGDKSQKKHLMDMLQKVYKQQSAVPDVVDCSWSGDDCAQTKCCNDQACSWDFKTCKGYSCYKDGATAKCMETAGWNSGTIIGGARAVRKVPQAAEGTTMQGTSLFCFMVVDWKAEEGAVANNIKEKKLGIYQCDANAILTGWQVSKTPWSTYMNADAFVKLWQQIQQQKQYLAHDYTVKVDADTVFFPNLLRMHLAGLKVPQGSRAYVKNLNFKFQFNGAIEVFTREAVQLYFEKGGACATNIIKAHPKAGEDFFMKSCMDGIGADGIEDFKMLRDSTCGTDCGAVAGPCTDGWMVAYHAYKDADSWNACHGEAVTAQKAAGHSGTGGAAELPAPVLEELPAVDGKDATKARDLLQSAGNLKDQLAPDAKAAEKKNSTAWGKIGDAKEMIHDAKQQIHGARANASDAAELKKEALKKIQQASEDEQAASKVVNTASATKKEGLGELHSAQSLADAAEAAESKAGQEKTQAVAAESKELGEIASQRVCLDLPGVRLESGEKLAVEPIVLHANTSTPAECTAWCRQHEECKQAVFSGGNKGCYLFAEAHDMPGEFTDGFNSSYCGGLDELESMKAMLNKVFKMKPWVPPVPQCAWAGDDCSQSKCCANVPVPNWKFTEFQWYTCYQKDPNFAGCHLGSVPGSWDGAVLGHAGTREVPKAPEGVLVQGTSLFCFAVVMWNHPATKGFWDSEAELANNIKKTGRSIMGCDDHAFFQGGELNGGGDASSINNIDSFIGAWDQVQKDGRYLHHDWTVKVDCDAVFFPDRLKMHLTGLRPPQGSRVYLRNINFKFEFLGALEVLTKEALQLYYKESWQCASKVGHEGGEDYYMLSCLDGIGVDHQTDHQLLNDKYAATGNCNDPWVVGFHFYKKVASWNACHDAAVNTAKNQGKPYWKNE